MMTREDLMRELELLPVWQLRAPLPTQASSQVQEPIVSEVTAEPAQINTTVLAAETIVEVVIEQDLKETAPIPEMQVTVESASTPQELTYISSDDGDWLFVLPSSVMSNEEQLLFQNICKALRIKTIPAEVSTDARMFIDNVHPKVLLALGEVPAQTLLLLAEPIEALRGSVHQLNGITLIPTYDLAYLLQNPADKAKVWSDLCFGLQTLQNLNVANS